MHKQRILSLFGFLLFVALFVSACGRGSEEQKTSCQSLNDCEAEERCSSDGFCTSETLSCTGQSDCAFDEYCGGGQCLPAACDSDEACTDAICVFDTCREGCRPGAGQCGEGESCNEVTFICEPAGCTPTSCRSRIQRCDQTQTPSACVFTGACDTDTQCLAYGNQLDDGREYICNQVTSECVVRPPCSADSDCRVGFICDESGEGDNRCREGCRTSDQCGSGQLCALDQGGVCVNGCASDIDCISDDGRSYFCRNLQCVAQCQTVDQCTVVGHICAGTPRYCQPCNSDSQCRSTQFCDVTRGATAEEIDDPSLGLCADLPPECPPSPFGENHAADEAHLITELPFEGGAADDLYFCRKNESGDWFAVDAAAGDLIEIELAYDTEAGNLDVALLRSNGVEIVAAARPPSVDNGREVIRYGVDQGARFLIQVRGSIVTRNTPYKLDINVGPAPACEDDALDPNSEQSPASLPPGQPQEGLIVCGEAPDYYSLSMRANQVVRVTAQAPDRLGTVRLSLRNAEGLPVAQVTSRQDTATLYWDTSEATTMTLVVEVTGGVGNVGYSLEWRQQDNVCTDVFEPNDSCESAPNLPIGTYPNLAVCTDADFYKVELSPFQELTARAIYDPATAAGELDIFLFGPNECLRLAASGFEVPTEGTEVMEVLNYQAVVGGEYYLMANLFQGLNVPYRLELEIADGPPCIEDRLSPNDTYTEAHEITRDGVYEQLESALVGLRVCDSNEDWFKIELEEGDKLEWHVNFRHVEGDIDAFLFGPEDQTNPLVSGTSLTDNEVLVHTVGAGEGGTYYLLVKGKFAVRTSYRLLTYLNDVGPENPLCPDQFGDNGARDRAAEVEVGTYGPLLVCGQPRSDDWFTTFVRAGETLTVRLDFAHADGRIDLRLFDDSSSSTPLVTSATTRNFEEVSYTTPRSQFLVWRVNTQTQVQWNTYTMTVAKENPDPCVDDRFAGNHVLANAEPIEAPGLYTRLRMCDDAEDWFTLELAEGEKAEAFIRFAGALGDLDLFVLGPDPNASDVGTQPPILVASSEGTTGTESVIWTASMEGTYYVRVAPKTPARIDYDLLMYRDTTGNGVLEGPEDRVCPDQFENNDTFATARPIAPGFYEDLLICMTSPVDQDYYSIFVPAGATLTTNLFFTHADGNIDMRVYRATVTQEVGFSRSTTDDESVTVTNSGQGETYVIQVYGGGGTNWRNYYAMEISLEFAGQCEDPTEAGDSRATAPSLSAGAYQNFQMCEGSEHWYRFDLGAGENLRAELELNDRFGHIDVEFQDAAGLVLASSNVSGNHKTINFDVPTAGDYYLRLYPRGDAFIRTSYDLWVSVAGLDPAVPFCTDPYERNDFPTLAYRMNLSQRLQYTDMLACGIEEDWYQVDLTANTAYEVAVFYDHGPESNVDIVVQDGSGDVLATVSTLVDDAILEFTPTATGAYLIGVRSQATGVTPYSMHVVRSTVYTNLAHCPEDQYEPNDSQATATDLGSHRSLRVALGACDDDDYFRWTAPADGTTTIETLFNNGKMNMGLEVRTTNPSAFLIEDFGDTIDNNRAGGTFEAVAGREYRIAVLRSLLPGNPNVTNGPYFLHIEQH